VPELAEFPRRATRAVDDHLRRVGIVGQVDAKRDPAGRVRFDVGFASAFLASHYARLSLARDDVEMAASNAAP
jgi:hypothetical protein